MMQVRALAYNKHGTIDCEIEHPVYGWIPFTATPDDDMEHGRVIYAEAIAGELGPVAPYVPPSEADELAAERARMVVSRFQARAALHLAGLLDQVEALMADPATDPIARLAWQDAQEFRRLSPTIALMGGALGLTDADLDQLFIQAAQIDA